MKIAVSAGMFAAFIGAVAAQSPVYGQCGGQGWTGPTTCASGSTCTYSNPYYSQCVPGGSGGGAPSTSAPASTTKTASSTSSAPSSTSTSTIDTTSHCGQYEQVTVGPYLLYTDLWGESGASSGSQCSQLISLSGTTVSWKTTWTWTGGTGVKSFSNIAAQQGLNKQLSAIKSIPSTWKWSQTSSGSITADVAYDLFTSNTAGGSNVNEIMIWMANYNAGPISATYGSNGQPTPVATNVSLGGQTWNLYFGSNGSNNVYSFLPATSGTTITSFSADLNLFLQYLTAHQGVSTSQYLVTAQAGTEPTVGSATLTTSAYSLVIN